VADVHCQHLRENSRISGKRPHGRAAQAGMITQSQPEPSHPFGTARDLAMLPLVFGQVAMFDRFG
jgi:hypothetical protein